MTSAQKILISRRAFLVGAPALILCWAWIGVNRAQAFQSLLLGWFFWTGLSLGSLGIFMVYQLTDGAWGRAVRPILEAGVRTLPLMGALFIPFAFGLQDLYPWARPGAMSDEHLRHLHPYLNAPFFLIRAVVYFAVWIGISLALCRASRENRANLGVISGPGLVLFGLTTTFAFIDWTMSLNPAWTSTIYGMMILLGHTLATFAMAVLVAAFSLFLQGEDRGEGPPWFHDLGNLLLASVMMWAYLSFSQYLIIWSGNLREEVPWYVDRTRGGWQWVIVVLIAFQFFAPFLLLLSREVKRRIEWLAGIAALILFMRFVDLYWLIVPAFHPGRIHLHVLDVFAPVGVGGLWVGMFARSLKPLDDAQGAAV